MYNATPGSSSFVIKAYSEEKSAMLANLANNFGFWDSYHAEHPGPTNTNRQFATSGSTCGMVDNTYQASGWFTNVTGTDCAVSIFESLSMANISWKNYYETDIVRTLHLPCLRTETLTVTFFGRSTLGCTNESNRMPRTSLCMRVSECCLINLQVDSLHTTTDSFVLDPTKTLSYILCPHCLTYTQTVCALHFQMHFKLGTDLLGCFRLHDQFNAPNFQHGSWREYDQASLRLHPQERIPGQDSPRQLRRARRFRRPCPSANRCASTRRWHTVPWTVRRLPR